VVHRHYYLPLADWVPEVRLQRAPGRYPRTIVCRLRALFADGVHLIAQQLELPSSAIGETVEIQLSSSRQESALSLPVETRWIRSLPPKECGIICLFQRDVPSRFLSELVTKGCVERGQKTLFTDVMAQWESDPHQVPVELENLTHEHVCFVSTSVGKGPRVLLKCQGTRSAQFTAKKQWEQPAEHGHLIMCSLEDQQGYEFFWRLTDSLKETASAAPVIQRGLSVLSQVGICLFLCFRLLCSA
jgi:hypothetical protein